MKRKLSALLLAVVMAFGLFPVGTAADEIYTPVSLSSGWVGYYVRMPATGRNSLNVTDRTIESFHVYDDGGTASPYSNDCEGYLRITVPSGCVPRIRGSVVTESTENDWLTIYDGSTESAPILGKERFGGTDEDRIVDVAGTSRTVLLKFTSNSSVTESGLELITYIVNEYDLNNATVTGIEDHYFYFGEPIVLNPVVRDVKGSLLTYGTDYVLTINNVNTNVIDSEGSYWVYVNPAPGTLFFNSTRCHTDVVGHLDGSGTQGDPYRIRNLGEWELFSIYINTGVSPYADAGVHYKLESSLYSQDMQLPAAVGTAQHPFRGVIDGDENHISAGLESTDPNTGVFGCVDGAVIQNLRYSGVISGGEHSAALVGRAKGAGVSISDCTVDVFNDSSPVSFAGFVGEAKDCPVTIEDSVCIGVPSAPEASVFLGAGNEASSLTIRNCLFRSAEGQGVSGLAFFRTQGACSVEQLYTTEDLGEPGVIVYRDKPLDVLCGQSSICSEYFYLPAEVTVGEAVSTGHELEAPVTVTWNGTVLTAGEHYTVSTDPAPILGPGAYTVTVTGIDPYCGSYVGSFNVTTFMEGSGTRDDPFLINDLDDLERMSFYVNSKISSYRLGAYWRLTADISGFTGMIGSGTLFVGFFDGDGHTIDVCIESEERDAALFTSFSGEIRNLCVTGTVTGGDGSGGLVGGCSTGVLIENCSVSVDLNCGGNCGGIIGRNTTTDVTIRNCVFSGSFLQDRNNGAFIGWESQPTFPLTMSDCLYIYSGRGYKPVDLVGNYGIEGSSNVNKTIITERCYRTTDFNGYLGTRVYLPDEDYHNHIVKSASILGYDFCIPCETAEIGLLALTGDPLSVVPQVSFEGKALVPGRDFTYSLTGGGSGAITEPGQYSMVLTGVNRKGFCGTAVIFFSVSAFSEGDYTYVNEYGYTNILKNGSYTLMNANEESLESGWYVMAGAAGSDVLNFSSRLSLQGDVKILLVNGKTLNALQGVGVAENGSVTFYAQTDDENTMGRLVVAGAPNNNPGIGGNGATVRIVGGNISAVGGTNCPGIGSGVDGWIFTTNVEIYGGIVTANGGDKGPGIGLGSEYRHGAISRVDIFGGRVTAQGGSEAAGIGVGSDCRSYVNVTIRGGEVTARGGSDAAGIGLAYSCMISKTNVWIYGGRVTAQGSGGVGIGGSRSYPGCVFLGWSDPGDYIYNSGSYNDPVSVMAPLEIEGTDTVLEPGSVSAYGLEGTRLVPHIVGYRIDAQVCTGSTPLAEVNIDPEAFYLGQVEFTVSSTNDLPCAVGVLHPDGTVTRLACTTVNGVHKYTVTVTNDDVDLIVVIKGDVDLNGVVRGKDSTLLKRHLAGTLNPALTSLQIFAGDGDGNGVISGKESTQLARYLAGTYSFSW